jgi:glycosyltransferase involved in cell wall biosynthesis
MKQEDALRLKPLVSVVLPTHNRAALLPKAIGSVLHQSFRDLELIVVDDGSTEDIRGLCETCGDVRVRYLRLDPRSGVAAARNAGIAAASGEYVAFQDSDDEWLLDKLHLQWRAAVRQRTVGRYPVNLPDNGQLSTAAVAANPFVYCQSWLVRRHVLLTEGGFDEHMRNWSDWEMLLRLSRRVRVHCIPEALVVSEQVADSLTVLQPAWLAALRHILEKHAPYLAGAPAEHADLRYILARLLIAAGELPSARRELMLSLRLRPGHWRSAAMLGLTLAGAAPLKRMLAR